MYVVGGRTSVPASSLGVKGLVTATLPPHIAEEEAWMSITPMKLTVACPARSLSASR